MKMHSRKYTTTIHSAILQWARLGSLLAMVTILIVVLTVSAPAQRYSDWSAPFNLGPSINTAGFDGCPSIAKNGVDMLFMSNFGATTFDMYVAHRGTRESPWGNKISLGGQINTAGYSEVCPSLSISGRFLYFASDRPGGCGDYDIYVARRLNKKNFEDWGEPQNIGCHVNGPGPDFSPSVFEDEDGAVYLYYSSGLRPGGMGFGDIYVTEQQVDGTFAPGTPVVEFNTTFNEIRPKIRARDGLEIFFDSSRPGGLGVDLYTSTRECTSCPWSPPVNLGSIVNSTAIDGGGALSFDATELYFMSNRPGGAGGQDIWVSRREKLIGFEANRER